MCPHPSPGPCPHRRPPARALRPLPQTHPRSPPRQVKYVVELAKTLGREVANCDEAREILSLPKEWKDRIVPQLDDGSGFKKHLEEQAAKAAAAPVN